MSNLDDRLIHRLAVRRILSELRSGQIQHDDLPNILSGLKKRAGGVMVSTLLQELSSSDHRDRQLATLCLQIMGDQEVEERCLEMVLSPQGHPQAKVAAIEVLESLGYEQDDLLPRIPRGQRPAIAEAMLESYIDLISDPDTLGGMLKQFLILREEDQQSYLEFFEASGDPRVVDFLWHVAERASGSTGVRARQALEALRATGLEVGYGPQDSLVSLLERDVGEDIDDASLLYWGFESAREGDFLMAEACLSDYLQLDPGHGPAALQLSSILAAQGRAQESLEVIEDMSHNLSSQDPHLMKALDIRAVLEGQSSRWTDPVEEALEIILGGLIPTTPHSFQLAVLMWNLFLQFSPTSLKKITKPVCWAAAVVYNLRRIMGLHLSGAQLARRVEGLEPVSSSTIFTRARSIREALGLESEEGAEWLKEELAHRLVPSSQDEGGFPDWESMSTREKAELDDYNLWTLLYHCPPGAAAGMLDSHPEMVSSTPGRGRKRSSYEWRKSPWASPYTLGQNTKATFILEGQRLTVLALSYRDMLEVRCLLQSGLGQRAVSERILVQPLFEVAPKAMASAASDLTSREAEIEVVLEMEVDTGEFRGPGEN